jgi:drug/metabolite transporter (DMT)-like permease
MPAKQLKWFLMIVVALIWGSSFILIKRGLVGLNAFQLGSLRMIFAGLFLLLIGFRTLPKIPFEKWKFIVLTALLGSFFPAYLFAIAETQIGSSITAILNSLTPLNTLILGVLVFGLDFKRSQMIGIAVGFVGSAMLIFSGAENNPTENYNYAAYVLVATVCYATNVNLIKKYLSDLSPLAISTGNFVAMLPLAFVILFFSGFFEVAQVPKVQESMVYIMILGVMGTGVANLLFFRVIQMSTPIFASSVTYLIPIVAFFWGLIDNESLTVLQLFGAAIILFGVYLSGKK